ncbi:hypothetical protein M9H77_04835 [Catharanthus roseus]|uniref:Uncharacterized protein n=1 Tax=Catharanthus roseus TaxID=4058 RepID=A0ACC0CFJ8_CATRO|nr:hypothetical protein M9H77_04835 [Catharanthus roseus]
MVDYQYNSGFMDFENYLTKSKSHEAKNCYLLVGFPAAERLTERWSTNASIGGRRGRGRLNRRRGCGRTSYGHGLSTSSPSEQQSWRTEEMAATGTVRRGAKLCSPGRGASRIVAYLHQSAKQELLARATVTASIDTPGSVGIPGLSLAQWTSFLNLLNKKNSSPPSSEDTLSCKVKKTGF